MLPTATEWSPEHQKSEPNRPHPLNTQSTGFQAIWTSQKRVLALLFLATTILVYQLSLPSATIPLNPPTPPKPGNLHLLIPASEGNANVCKTLLSAAILGYPTPVLVNWNRTFDSPGLVAGGSHLAKIQGVHDSLAALDETHDEDLVILIDGLRPQTLLDRYFSINRKADQRIRAELGPTTAHRQEIIFGAQKRCWPWNAHDPPCYAVPSSTLPRDIYGPQTDTDIGDERNPYLKYRPRFLNSGFAMGTVRAMRKLFQQARRQAEVERNFGSDQFVLSQIFGDQEVWREIVRRESVGGGFWGRAMRAIWGRGGEGGKEEFLQEHLEEVRAKAKAREDGNFEFGIGMDYASELVLNTVFAEDDTAWLVHGGSSDSSDSSNSNKQEEEDGPLTDIATTPPPFWTFSPQPTLPRWLPWSSIPLFTNTNTTIIPALIHHNAHRDGLKSLRETWWPRIWFYNHSRTLLDAGVYAPVGPVAVAGEGEGGLGNGREWWAYDYWKGGARDGEAPVGLGREMGDLWVRFDDVCREWHGEVFGDGGGGWELPANH